MINTKAEPCGDYYAELRLPMLSLVRGVPDRVLEIGCASGQHLHHLKEKGSGYTVGVELSPNVAERARQRSIDSIFCGNFEDTDFGLVDSSFDLVIVGHVLEHLRDPWQALRRIHRLLAPGGQLVGALPNVRHCSVVLPLLLKGTWKYSQSGIMDWTHLRFFSRSTILDLLQTTGFKIDAITGELGGKRSRLVNQLTFNLFRDHLSYAYNFSATKIDSPVVLHA